MPTAHGYKETDISFPTNTGPYWHLCASLAHWVEQMTYIL